MNKKITFPELIESVATTTEASKRTSEMFLKELFAVIADSLVKGENVKIKNFGQFKLTEVGERKSVNVNTGEEMKIPSHTKVSFIPDKVLADAINMPFANFEAIELSDNISESELKIMASTEDGQVAKADAEGRKKQFDGCKVPTFVLQRCCARLLLFLTFYYKRVTCRRFRAHACCGVQRVGGQRVAKGRLPPCKRPSSAV